MRRSGRGGGDEEQRGGRQNQPRHHHEMRRGEAGRGGGRGRNGRATANTRHYRPGDSRSSNGVRDFIDYERFSVLVNGDRRSPTRASSPPLRNHSTSLHLCSRSHFFFFHFKSQLVPPLSELLVFCSLNRSTSIKYIFYFTLTHWSRYYFYRGVQAYT